jgi:hypothetical protein
VRREYVLPVLVMPSMAWPTSKDTLRWEWRTFSPSLADLEAKIGLAVQIAAHHSDEIYLLCVLRAEAADSRWWRDAYGCDRRQGTPKAPAQRRTEQKDATRRTCKEGAHP